MFVHFAESFLVSFAYLLPIDDPNFSEVLVCAKA